jgi:hypothetical protein
MFGVKFGTEGHFGKDRRAGENFNLFWRCVENVSQRCAAKLPGMSRCCRKPLVDQRLFAA